MTQLDGLRCKWFSIYQSTQVAIDTNDQEEHVAYTVVGLHPRYKQVVAERLAVAGLRVAYGHSWKKVAPALGTWFQIFG